MTVTMTRLSTPKTTLMHHDDVIDADADDAAAPTHYGSKPGHFKTSKIHFPTSEGVSEVSARANE